MITDIYISTSNIWTGISMERISRLRSKFTTDLAASYLSKSPGANRNMVMRRQVLYRKVTGRLVFFKDEIDRWADRCPGIPVDKLVSKN
jgi:hypothetical protein